MKIVQGAINIYKSGHYHRKGKPGQFDRHPGDIYPTMEAALADVDPEAVDKDGNSLYVATTPVVWLEPDDTLDVNPLDSEPVPLSQTRVRHRLPSQVVGMRPLVAETFVAGPGPDRDAQEVIAEYKAEQGFGSAS